ncbi:Lrp/AsnC family transcriptional regulator [Rahnella perminowiae]|jgi:Lrp/AsnC family transcriptional regulator, leucine-responsive regulatory protein|uniref:Lrp/AsnC family transcriptional regulator n=1 Tax=Rahnella perminowiae TaxID=2816244 RepID=A0ABS6KYA9_9GAMM|nr:MULTISPECIES: Lrp/AsnC family transcriptional regulator [Rahnella]UJD88036.1 Lrp/AsnC family transcriptional regulator [Rahnella aquatilis]MBU9810604.1 Lrp/AsnC family transcriptional regulator [Rahnella perminowiae]MBU9826002.1 Lrp/AsnC family transcriptional regulator [Rahnella perminowiae]MBU9834257.1 Lrp/AsnC family transcriptional regulator [Rahnella perminowiae]MCR9002915.1 Lrp/AsnC family transcriptional regulator [Rahnella perminowiae]
MSISEISPADLRILKQLQGSGRMTNQELAEKVGMAASPCWRRMKQLEDSGVITGYQANIDRKKIGLGLLAFIRVKIDSHSEEDAQRFELQVGALPSVIACYAIAGDADFLLQVVAKDLDSFSSFAMEVVRRLPGIKEMQTSFVLREIKPLDVLPLEGI